MKRVYMYVQVVTLFWVCITTMFVVESLLTKQKLFSWLRRRLKLIKKIVHFSVSMLMLNSERMVLLHLKHKSFALDFYRIIVSQTSFITWLLSQHHILTLKKKLLKAIPVFGNHHTYLTREPLPAEERVSKFHNHGKTPSHQTFTDASMRKVVPKSYGSHLKG